MVTDWVSCQIYLYIQLWDNNLQARKNYKNKNNSKLVKQRITDEMFYLPLSKPWGFFSPSKTKFCFKAELYQHWQHVSVSLKRHFPTGNSLTRKLLHVSSFGAEWSDLPRDADLPGQDTRVFVAGLCHSSLWYVCRSSAQLLCQLCL